MGNLTANEWLGIITHVKKWVGNLLRAKSERKKESKSALRAVVKAVTETVFYLKDIEENNTKSMEGEKKLSLLWTELSFQVVDIGLKKLAGQCRTMGLYWEDPSMFEDDKLRTARSRLSDIETLALKALQDI